MKREERERERKREVISAQFSQFGHPMPSVSAFVLFIRLRPVDAIRQLSGQNRIDVSFAAFSEANPTSVVVVVDVVVVVGGGGGANFH